MDDDTKTMLFFAAILCVFAVLGYLVYRWRTASYGLTIHEFVSNILIPVMPQLIVEELMFFSV